jgi:hypothetical protein
MDINPILQAVAAHQWEVVGGLFVGAIVATCKQGWAGAKIQALLPPRFIPFLAPTYAALAVLAADLVAGKSLAVIEQTVGAAIVSGFIAVVGHELLIEGIRNGKELVPSKPPKAPPASSSTTPTLKDPS